MGADGGQLPKGSYVSLLKTWQTRSRKLACSATNTEVSQAIADTLYGALGVIAGSQGTMNNFVYGNDVHQNYKTICGGTGAGDGFHGTSAVHSHMTNTRMTDPEVLETRFPVRIDEFSILSESGGVGEYCGGSFARDHSAGHRQTCFRQADHQRCLSYAKGRGRGECLIPALLAPLLENDSCFCLFSRICQEGNAHLAILFVGLSGRHSLFAA